MKYIKLLRHFFLSLYVLCASLLLCILIYVFLFNNASSDIILYTTFNVIIESIFTISLLVILVNNNPIIYAFLLLSFIVIYIFQTYIYYYTGSLITAIMWDNIDLFFDAWTLYSIDSQSMGVLISGLGLGVILTFYSTYYKIKNINNNFCYKILLLIIPIYIFANYQSAKFQKDYIKHSSLFMSPIAGIVNFWFSHLTYDLHNFVLLTETSTEYNLNQKYPLHKNILLSADIDKIVKNRLSNPDVFLVFMEGTSSYLLQDKIYSKNIHDFFRDGLVVRNYFNHTASTIRGLHGQLTSTYTRMRPTTTPVTNSGWLFSNFEDGNWLIPRLSSSNTTRYDSLATVLKKEGFYTVFIHPESQGTVVDVMAHSLGFDRIIARNDIEELIPESKNDRLFDVFSRDEYVLKSSTLIHQKYKSQMGIPLCIVVYTVGTHSFAAPSNQNIKFNSSIWLYQRIESFNNDIQILFDYYDTITSEKMLILTTDHAIFPEPSYSESRKEDRFFVPIIIDQIPLFIKSNKIFKNVMDVHGRNSVDLIPTILDLIEGPERRASFMGASLFIENNTNYSVSALGDEMYFINNSVIVTNMSPQEKILFKKLTNNIRLVYELEEQHRISSGT